MTVRDCYGLVDFEFRFPRSFDACLNVCMHACIGTAATVDRYGNCSGGAGVSRTVGVGCVPKKLGARNSDGQRKSRNPSHGRERFPGGLESQNLRATYCFHF